MNSILTNTGAMTALQVLNQANKSMAVTQSRISTGLKVANASDNAAIYAMTGTMKADVAGYETIQEGLGLAESAASVGRAAAESAGSLLESMKKKITQSQDGNIDRSQLQKDIDDYTAQIKTIVESASFNGINYLKSDDDVQILSSLNRSTADGVNYTVTTSSIDFKKQNLSFDDKAATAVTDHDLSKTGEAKYTFGNLVSSDTITAGSITNVTLSFEDGKSYSIATSSFTATDMDTATTGFAAQLQDAIQTKMGDTDGNGSINGSEAADTSITVIFDSGTGELKFTDGQGRGIAASFESDASGKLSRLETMDVTTKAGAANALEAIESLSKKVLSSASALGQVQNRTSVQKDFLGKLSDALKTGIGTLVDADMTQESARLQALQVQQQLAAQSLGIANQAPQTLLSLFRG
jgi:flagellin